MAKKKPDDAAAEAERRFKADLKAGTLGSFYIICGEEAFLRSHYVELATKKLTDGPAGEFNFHRFSADDCTPQALADAIDAMPMMAERTLVRVDDVDLFKQPEGAREQYAAILSDIPDYCCVLFVYDTVEFKINSTMKKLAAAVKEHAQIVSFGKQSERSLCAWITRHFRAHGKSVTDELCQYLIFRTDGLMTTLGGEIDKIAAYQEGEAITRGAIDAVVIPALSAQTFDISDAVVNRDFEKALFKLQELYAMQTDPVVVLGAIGAQLRRLYYARVILSSGGGQKELMELTGLKSYPAGLTMTAARRVTDRFCQSAIQLVLDTDLAMKTSAGEQEQLLELLLVRLAQEAQHGYAETPAGYRRRGKIRPEHAAAACRHGDLHNKRLYRHERPGPPAPAAAGRTDDRPCDPDRFGRRRVSHPQHAQKRAAGNGRAARVYSRSSRQRKTKSSPRKRRTARRGGHDARNSSQSPARCRR